MSMIEAIHLKAGATFLMEGKPYRVVKYSHQKIARGGGTVKLSLMNLETGKLGGKTLNSSFRVQKIETIKKTLQYLYRDGSKAIFIDPQTYEQEEIPVKAVSDQLSFIKEGGSVNILFWDQKPLSIDIPPKVTLEVKDTAPSVKGDSTTNVYKPAILENGLKLKVPLFIKKGDKIKVDTRTGEYTERVSNG